MKILNFLKLEPKKVSVSNNRKKNNSSHVDYAKIPFGHEPCGSNGFH